MISDEMLTIASTDDGSLLMPKTPLHVATERNSTRILSGAERSAGRSAFMAAHSSAPGIVQNQGGGKQHHPAKPGPESASMGQGTPVPPHRRTYPPGMFHHTIDHTEPAAPNYLNLGCYVHSDGITGIEIDQGEIRLVKWAKQFATIS